MKLHTAAEMRIANIIAERGVIEAERAKAAQTLPEMLLYLSDHPDAHTPFMQRWFELCIEANTMVYPARPKDAAAGRKVLHGRPKRLVEVIESAERFGKRGVWFVKIVETPKS